MVSNGRPLRATSIASADELRAFRVSSNIGAYGDTNFLADCRTFFAAGHGIANETAIEGTDKIAYFEAGHAIANEKAIERADKIPYS